MDGTIVEEDMRVLARRKRDFDAMLPVVTTLAPGLAHREAAAVEALVEMARTVVVLDRALGPRGGAKPRSARARTGWLASIAG